MRDVVLYELVSLDGVAEEPGDWMFDGGSEVFANLTRVIESQTDILLGRGTYDYWVDYWPTSDIEPFATFINSTRKHVFTSTPLTGEWANTVVSGEVADYVGALKREEGGDIGVHGSIRIAQSLMRANLVDRLELVVAPTIAGRGVRLFDGDETLRRFDLAQVQGSSGGAVFLTYRAADQ